MVKFDREFMRIARPIINHDEYKKMKDIPHHNESVFDHCMDTAYISYRITKKLGFDYEATVRGCLLHDFYLYKFKKGTGMQLITKPFLHTKHHPKIALKNAMKHFHINKKEKDIIENHMFPIGLPKSKEAWVVTFVDKFAAIIEYGVKAKDITKEKYRVVFSEAS